MRIDIPELIENLQNPWCNACNGEGYFITLGWSSYWDPHQDNWYPEEDYDPCDDCAGTGNLTQPHTRLGRIYTHLSKLTPEEHADLLNLYQPATTPIAASSYQALWKFLENLEIETGPHEPAAEELQQLLANCTLTPTPQSATTHQPSNA